VFDLRRQIVDTTPMPGWQDQVVARPDGQSLEANVHAAWRLSLAEQAAGIRVQRQARRLDRYRVGGGPVWPNGSLTSNWTVTGPIPGDLDRSGLVQVLVSQGEAHLSK
jgi:hypothetical protein